MAEFIDNISQFIESQFPRLYRERLGDELTEQQRSVLVDFVEAYYEYIEENYPDQFIQNRKMFEYRDVDQTLNEFITYFRKKYLDGLVYTAAVDERFLIKNIIDLYRSKGSDASIRLLIRMLFNEDATVYYPGRDILRASDSTWVQPVYVEVISSERSRNFVNKRIFGSISGARAFVEAVITKRSNNRLIDIIYLSDIEGTFVYGDIITDDGVLAGAPKVTGSLNSVTIDRNTIGGNALGDLFEVNGEFGQGGVVRVTGIRGRSGAVEFTIDDGGFGYTLTDDTQVLVSDIVVVANNSDPIFETESNVFQRLEKIYLDVNSGEDFIANTSVGDIAVGIDESNNAIANVTIMELSTEVFNSIITPYVIVQTEEDGSLLKRQNITFANDVIYEVGSTLIEGNEVNLRIDNANGSFTNGEIVYQREFLPDTGNTISSTYISGEVVDSNSTIVSLTNVFGDFSAAFPITGRSSGATADVLSANITFEGTSGVIDSKVANNQYILLVETEFTGNNKVRSVDTRVQEEIASFTLTSVVSLESGAQSANVQIVSNNYFTGTVVGQNTINIGIASTGNNDFIMVSNTSVISDANTDFVVQEISTGSGASFEIGTITNEETINVKTEYIVDTNIFGIRYKNIKVSGEGSGVGYVDSVTVNSGGSGYTNSSTVSFIGGGFLDQDPLIPASATVTTDGGGAISSINVTDIGEGYFTTPTIVISDGTGANTELEMVFGYGFPKLPLANSNTIIGDALVTSNVTIGTIASLTNNRPGNNYTGRPFVSIINPQIASFVKQDQVATINLTFGAFVVGETVTQANSDAKGIVTEANTSVVKLRNISFNEDFSIGGSISGSSSLAEATINNITYDPAAEIMGKNAVINNFVIEAQGVIANVAVVDSGLGYVLGENVTLLKDGIEITGTANVSQQGIEPGYWKTRSSHISSEKKLQDNDYWQEFSYDIQTAVSLNEYRDIILDIIHLSGTKLFGSVVKANVEEVTFDSESEITQS